MKRKRLRLSKTSAMHYEKLVFRSGLFIAALALDIVRRVHHLDSTLSEVVENSFLPPFIWAVFMIEMLLRFFPAGIESMGCQKQFARNFRPTAVKGRPKLLSTGRILGIAGSWLLLNGVIGALYYAGVIDQGVLLLICLAYSVCDMICILFFCPFQTLFMKNKCCGSCRIYNWDYAMMFTPLVFIKSVYSWSLLAFALALLIRWEVTAWQHPERFAEETNASLACANCQEKLCHHKKQLKRFWMKNKGIFSRIKRD